ncbi:hypothetical protein ABS71_18830 [bacterium SCN 62-11]|nr:MAG: hypothetical protein ABS71_18830 [bacterium SCN 62-11]
MRYTIYLATFAAFLSLSSWSEPVELVKDGNFEMAPSLKDGPGVENHNNLNFVWHVPAGKTSIPFWETAGSVHLWNYLPHRRKYVDLNGGKGTISQVLPTEAGKSYSLWFRYWPNDEGGAGQSMLVKYGGETRRFPAEGNRSQYIDFKAKGPTEVTFMSGSKTAKGPILVRVRCDEFNPEADKIRGAFDSLYKILDRGEKNEADLPKLLEVLADDFSYKPREGNALDRAGFEELVRQRQAKKFKVNTAIEDLVPQADGTVLVEIERRQQEPGDYGKLQTSAPHFKQTWVKSGSGWKLKSSEEIEPKE